MQPLLSIIIPAYNTEQYIGATIESILNQSYHNLEIIIVNDGSTDNTKEVCEKYNDPKIKLVNKENGGPGSARNIGLDLCNGDLITFVDSDDFISKDCYITNIGFFLKDNQLDILQFPFCRYKDGEVQKGCFPEEKEVIDKNQMFKDAFDTRILRSYMPNKIFRRHIFDNIRFNEKIFFEDREILPILIENSSKIKYSIHGLYYYRIRPGQITETFRTPKILFSEIISYISIMKTLKKYDSLYNIILSIYSECIHYSKLGEKILWKEVLKNKPHLFKSLSSNATLGYKFLAIKAHLFPYLL